MNTSLITPTELQADIGKGIVVIDCRFNLMDKTLGYQQYLQGHIPGAYYFDLERDLSGPVTQHGGRHPLPSIESLEKKLRSSGVNKQSLVVVYDDSRMAYAARAWWLLRYLGHEHIAILDGGFSAWRESNGALDRREPPGKSGNFKADVQADQTIDYDAIVNAAEQFTLVDSREAQRYAGKEEPIDPIAGHIPGAINCFWQDITTDNGLFKSTEWQKEHWKTLPTNKDVVVYCGSGVTACVNIFSLAQCGIKAKLYPGSWSDWCSHSPARGHKQEKNS